MSRISGLKGLKHSHLFIFSVPTILSSVLEPLTGVVDTGLVGRLSTEWLAALAFCATLFSSLTWVFNFIVHASTQTIADFTAQKDPSILAGRIKICLLVAFVVGLGSSLFLGLFRLWLYRLIGASQELFPLMDDYYMIRVFGHLFTVLYITLISILRGFGHVRACFLLLALTTIGNIGLSYYFLYGQGLGLEGAAYGTVLSNFLGCGFSFLLIYREPCFGKRIFTAKPPKDQWFRFGKNSLDLFGRSATLTACFFLATRFAGRLGVETLGAHQVLLQLWLLMSFFQDGFAITGNILGARFFGQRRIKKTRLVFRRLLHLGGFIGFVFMLIYLLLRDPLLNLFTRDPDVLKICIKIWPLIWLSQIISGVAFVYDGLIFGLEGFDFLRKHMILGAVFVFFPLVAGSLIWDSLVLIWSGLVLLNVYRALSGFSYVKRTFSSH